MSTHTRPEDTDPTPTPGGSALAAPCRNCGTTGGHTRPGLRAPLRNRGYCSRCYQRARKHGFPAVVPSPSRPRGGSYRPPVAHTCVGCGAEFLAYASHNRRYCSLSCFFATHIPEHPAPLPRQIITPAMLGCRPGDPPTDPDCTPDRVWQIGNTNTRRALQWLARHTNLTHREALAVAVWEPARLATEDAARAA